MASFLRWLQLGYFGLVIGTATANFCHAQTVAVSEWQRQISARLASQKRFPLEAMGQSGAGKVAFTVDRSGHLVSDELIESTGFSCAGCCGDCDGSPR